MATFTFSNNVSKDALFGKYVYDINNKKIWGAIYEIHEISEHGESTVRCHWRSDTGKEGFAYFKNIRQTWVPVKFNQSKCTITFNLDDFSAVLQPKK
jgi:hypothetical protein